MDANQLEPYRRHGTTCKYVDEENPQQYTRCGCPIWCYGRLGGKVYRRSLGVRDWARALKRIDKILEKPEQAVEPRSLAAGIKSYLDDCRARGLKESTVTSYAKTLEYMRAFAEARDKAAMDQLDLALLTDFRSQRRARRPWADTERPISGSTSNKELEALRAFGAFALRNGWTAKNFAKEIRPAKADGTPTLPFAEEEVGKILDACDRLTDDNPNTLARTRTRARALCLTLLYSGLRISDAIKLERKAVDLQSGKLFLRMMKTGVPLYVRLGDLALEALAALPVENEQYFFWNGTAKLSTAVGNARKTIARACSLAGVNGQNPHRFRDTFSVRLLELGNDLRTVQLLLGHTSIKTTEKHYAPFVKSFQAHLDAATAGLDFGRPPRTISRTIGKKVRTVLKIKRLVGGS